MIKKIQYITSLICFLGFCTHALAYDVMFNTQTLKYHSVDCKWAIKCTKNCIMIDDKEAQRRGGIPCKVCGG